MAGIFTVDNIVTLGLLALLQAVLGFDNLLYISVESKRAPADKQRLVRRLGFSLHSIIVLVGGVFLIYTATKEILHMMNLEEMELEERKPRSVGMIIFWIVSMNMVFSFDSILAALALTDVFWVMAVAIIIGGLLMIWLGDHPDDQGDVLLRHRGPGAHGACPEPVPEEARPLEA